MTDDLILIAKACGWTEVTDRFYQDKRAWIRGKARVATCDLDYDSLDSMQSAVLMQDEEFQERFAEILEVRALLVSKHGEYARETPHFHQLTIPDWQQAFVETLEQLKRV